MYNGTKTETKQPQKWKRVTSKTIPKIITETNHIQNYELETEMKTKHERREKTIMIYDKMGN